MSEKCGVRMLIAVLRRHFEFILGLDSHCLLEVDCREEGSDAASQHNVERHNEQICRRHKQLVHFELLKGHHDVSCLTLTLALHQAELKLEIQNLRLESED